MKTTVAALAAFLTLGVHGADFRKDDIHRVDLGSHKAVWLEDDRYPVATVVVYFADGALRDSASAAGTTQTTFDLLFAGTPKHTQAQLSEFFDFYGVGFEDYVSHEYSTLSFTALVKDLPAVVERFCHVVREADFPRSELLPHQQRTIARLKNLPSSHSALADRAVRAVMMRGSSYEWPVEGTVASLQTMRPEALKARWAQLRDEAPKRFYVRGPREALFIKDKFLQECGWKASASQTLQLKNPVGSMAHRVFFVPVPGANQAQVRIGRYLSRQEATDPDERLSLAADFMGGGFTSRLMQEVRVKRGLTYSVNAFVSIQAEYGRAGISTFTKSQTVGELLSLIRRLVGETARPENVKEEQLKHVRDYVIGHYPFNFQGSDKFLMQILALDHAAQSVEKLYRYPERVKALGPAQVADAVGKLFTWEEQVIVVVGDPSIRSQLEKIRPVEVITPESLL